MTQRAVNATGIERGYQGAFERLNQMRLGHLELAEETAVLIEMFRSSYRELFGKEPPDMVVRAVKEAPAAANRAAS